MRRNAMSSLTPRELEVLKLVARGLKNSEIAEALFLSEATVKTQSHVCWRSSTCVIERRQWCLRMSPDSSKPARSDDGSSHAVLVTRTGGLSSEISRT